MEASIDSRRAPRARLDVAERATALARMTSNSVLIVLALVAVLLFGTLAVTLGGSDAAVAAGDRTPTVSQVTWAGESSGR